MRAVIFLAVSILSSSFAWAAASKCELNLLRHRIARVSAIYLESGVLTIPRLQRMADSSVPKSPAEGLSRILENERAIEFYAEEMASPEIARDWEEIRAEIRIVLAVAAENKKIEEKAKKATEAVLFPQELQVELPDTFVVNKWFTTRDGRLLYVVTEQTTQTVQKILEFPSGKPVWVNRGNIIGQFAALEENDRGELEIVEFSTQDQREDGWNLILRKVFNTSTNAETAYDRFLLQSGRGALRFTRLRSSSDTVSTGWNKFAVLDKGQFLESRKDAHGIFTLEQTDDTSRSILNGLKRDFLLEKHKGIGSYSTVIESVSEGTVKHIHNTPFFWPGDYDYIKGLQLPDGSFTLAASERTSEKGFYYHPPAFDGSKSAEIFETGTRSQILEIVRTQDGRLLLFVRVKDGNGSQLRIYEPARGKKPIFSTHIYSGSDQFIHYTYLEKGRRFYLGVADEARTFHIYEPLKDENEVGEVLGRGGLYDAFLFPGQGDQIFIIGRDNRLVQAFTLFNASRGGPSSVTPPESRGKP